LSIAEEEDVAGVLLSIISARITIRHNWNARIDRFLCAQDDSRVCARQVLGPGMKDISILGTLKCPDFDFRQEAVVPAH
jgi:hypothetical protein